MTLSTLFLVAHTLCNNNGMRLVSMGFSPNDPNTLIVNCTNGISPKVCDVNLIINYQNVFNKVTKLELKK